jgi:hypothetical protein
VQWRSIKHPLATVRPFQFASVVLAEQLELDPAEPEGVQGEWAVRRYGGIVPTMAVYWVAGWVGGGCTLSNCTLSTCLRGGTVSTFTLRHRPPVLLPRDHTRSLKQHSGSTPPHVPLHVPLPLPLPLSLTPPLSALSIHTTHPFMTHRLP